MGPLSRPRLYYALVLANVIIHRIHGSTILTSKDVRFHRILSETVIIQVIQITNWCTLKLLVKCAEIFTDIGGHI